ncbi:hypothetical protein ACFLZ7_03125 [Nanoarchaeota archaeon]
MKQRKSKIFEPHFSIKMRKAQMVGQIFIYVLAVVVAGGILLFGYNAIKTFGQQAEDVSFVKFKTQVENDFKGLSSDFGSVKIKNYEPGAAFELACFIDKKIISAEGSGYEALFNSYPIILDAVTTLGGTPYDLFLVPGEKQIDLGTVEVSGSVKKEVDISSPHEFLCVKVANGKFSLRIEGTGRSTIVSEYTR